MSRDDLLLTNMRITSAVTEEVARHSPDCIILAVTNPLDAMVQNVYQTAGFPRNRVFGMAGVLDTARYRTFIAQELTSPWTTCRPWCWAATATTWCR